MENSLTDNITYFISDFILVFGLIFSIASAIKSKAGKPKHNLALLITVLTFCIAGYLPVFGDLIKLAFPNATAFNAFGVSLFNLPFSDYSLEFLSKNIQITPLAMLFKFLITLSALLTIILGYSFIKKLNQKTAKFCSLFLFGLIGAQGTVMANDFLSLFISIEILSMATYFIIACFSDKNDKNALSKEASVKYFTLSEVASCFMLFGISYIYLTLGTVNFSEINTLIVNKALIQTPVLNIAEILFFTAFVFKIGAYPFYIWVMDVFKGSDYSVGLFISTILKVAAVGALVKTASILGFFGSILCFGLILSAVLTLVLGNLLMLRIVKKADSKEGGSFKEFLAASSVANIGYVFLGISFLTKDSIVSGVYYLIIYLIMNFGLWAAFMLISRNLRTVSQNESENIQNLNSLRGLAYINPPFATMISICLLSFAAFPIMAGFGAKFFLFASILRSGIWAVYPLIFVAFASILAVYSYFKIISIIFKKPDNLKIYKKKLIFDRLNPYTFILSVASALLIILFFFSSPVITMLNGMI